MVQFELVKGREEERRILEERAFVLGQGNSYPSYVYVENKQRLFIKDKGRRGQ